MDDERKGVQAAKLFVEKGYENIFLLNGGIEAFLEQYSELVEGRCVPIPKQPSELKGIKKPKSAKTH